MTWADGLSDDERLSRGTTAVQKTSGFYNAALAKPRMTQPSTPLIAPGDLSATVDAKTANGWLHTARFLTTAPQLEHLPPLQVPEIAFVGRSNAGKSTCINTLTQQKRLAFASKTPGRTQSINLFSLGKHNLTDAVLADLPGYGYAAVPKEAKLRWQRVMANYLRTRPNLMGVVMMCDPRLGLTELDEILLDVIRERVADGLKLLLLLTKSDKLTRIEGQKVLSITQLQCGGGQAKLFSALKKQGVDEVAQLLWQWTHPAGHNEAAAPTDPTADTDETAAAATAAQNPGHEPDTNPH
jgi:GTP-binding protein